MLQGKHSAILCTCIKLLKLPFVRKIFVLSLFELLLKTEFTVHLLVNHLAKEDRELIVFL